MDKVELLYQGMKSLIVLMDTLYELTDIQGGEKGGTIEYFEARYRLKSSSANLKDGISIFLDDERFLSTFPDKEDEEDEEGD